MRTVDLSFPTPNSRVEAEVEEEASRQGLTWTKDTLRTYPGCTHWHFRSMGHTGTLEITWHPDSCRLWIKVASNRDAPWIDEAIDGFVERFGIADA